MLTDSFSIEQLEQALVEAGQDEPTQAELNRYKQLFRHVNTAKSSLLQQFAVWVQAHLVWDSRDEPLLQGMRSAATDSYRLRYAAESAIIELAIERNGRMRQIEGEIYSDDDDRLLMDTGPAFITLLRYGEIVEETTTDTDGRFSFAELTASDYGMTLFLGDRARIELVDVNVL